MTITKKTERLFNNSDFQDIILKGYILDQMNELVLNGNIDNKNVQDKLKSIQNLDKYLKQCLEYDNIEKIRKESE